MLYEKIGLILSLFSTMSFAVSTLYVKELSYTPKPPEGLDYDNKEDNEVFKNLAINRFGVLTSLTRSLPLQA